VHRCFDFGVLGDLIIELLFVEHYSSPKHPDYLRADNTLHVLQKEDIPIIIKAK